MRVAAAAFALALGFMSPTSAVSSPTKWTEVELFAVVVELAGAEQVCKTSLKVDLLTLGRLDYIAEERFGDEVYSDENLKLYGDLYDKLVEASKKPTTYCWAMLERYGPAGTVLPGAVSER